MRCLFFFSSRRRHTRSKRDWSSDVCSSDLIGVDANEPFPVICPAAPCPTTYPATFPIGIAGTPVPPGTYFIPPPQPKPNTTLNNTWTWFSRGDSAYNALQIDVNRRFSVGLTLRGVYTYSKLLDDGDSLNATP